MPTRRQIQKVARVECRVGESRDGFARDNDCAMTGPPPKLYRTSILSRQASGDSETSARKAKSVTIRLHYVEDKKTGRRSIKHE